MLNLIDCLTPSDQRPRRGAIVALLFATMLIGGPTPTVAQEATPAVAPALVDACATVLASTTMAASTAASDSGATAPAFNEIPFDVLAIDTLASHDVAVVALLTVGLAGIEQLELRQLVEASRAEYRTESMLLADARSARFPEAPVVPAEYQTALLDQALAAAGVPAGSGQAPLIDPLHGAEFLCTIGMTVPFDLAVIDLLSSESQNGMAIGVLTTERAEDPALLAQGQGVVDRETTLIGQLAIWRDAWFGPGAPLVVVPTEGGHEHAAPSA